MNSPRRAESVENSRVSFPFDSLPKSVQGMSHLCAIHTGVIGVRPKIARCIVMAHFSEAFSCGRLDVGESCDLAPVQFLAQGPLKFFFFRTIFLLDQIREEHRTVNIRRYLTIQSYYGARQRY